MKAGDVMTTDVVAVGPETSVQEIAQTLLEHRISAVFVVDGEGRPIGVVSEGDLMRRAETDTVRSRSWWLRAFVDSDTLAQEYAKAHGRHARDVMTRSVVRVAEDADLADVATLLETHRIKRVPVVRDDRIVGVVSRANLLRALASMSAKGTVSAADRAIRDGLRVKFSSQSWVIAHDTNVLVEDGVVQLWGRAVSEDARSAMRAAADSTPGVKAVEDHLVVMPILQWD